MNGQISNIALKNQINLLLHVYFQDTLDKRTEICVFPLSHLLELKKDKRQNLDKDQVIIIKW